jgi:hypothetical protein
MEKGTLNKFIKENDEFFSRADDAREI